MQNVVRKNHGKTMLGLCLRPSRINWAQPPLMAQPNNDAQKQTYYSPTGKAHFSLSTLLQHFFLHSPYHLNRTRKLKEALVSFLFCEFGDVVLDYSKGAQELDIFQKE